MRKVALKYQEIADDLERRIKSGEFDRVRKLPPQSALINEYGISKRTITQAVEVLRARGCIRPIQGRHTLVNRPRLEKFEIDEREVLDIEMIWERVFGGVRYRFVLAEKPLTGSVRCTVYKISNLCSRNIVHCFRWQREA